VSDNTKLKTQQYRDMLYGICDASAHSRGRVARMEKKKETSAAQAPAEP